MKRICILTQDIFGPVRNAGIGTAYKHAAEFLCNEGHEVTILFTQGRQSQNNTFNYWVSYYKERGISLIGADFLRNEIISSSAALRWSYQGYQHLRKLPSFDIVHSSECGGSPYFSLLAKKAGSEFAETIFCIKTSSPQLWSCQGNFRNLHTENGSTIAKIERLSVEMADLVIAPSQHMLDWMQAHGYTLPKNVCVHPNIIPALDGSTPVKKTADGERVREVCFFGRLEPRKGLELFANAIRQIASQLADKAITITFLGKRTTTYDFDKFFLDLTSDVKVDMRSITNMNAEEANNYLSSPARLAVIPSFLDNSPFTVFESLVNRHLFIASDIGGIPELVHPEDRQRVLFPPRALSLGRKILEVVDNRPEPARLSFDINQSQSIWRDFHLSPSRNTKSETSRYRVDKNKCSFLVFDENDLISLDSIDQFIASSSGQTDLWLISDQIELSESGRQNVMEAFQNSGYTAASHSCQFVDSNGSKRTHLAQFFEGWDVFNDPYFVPQNIFLRHDLVEDLAQFLHHQKVIERVSIDEIAFIAAVKWSLYPVNTDEVLVYRCKAIRARRRPYFDNRVLMFADAILPPAQSYTLRAFAELKREHEGLRGLKGMTRRLLGNLSTLDELNKLQGSSPNAD